MSSEKKKQKENTGKKGPRKTRKTVLMWLAIAIVVVFALRAIEGFGTRKEVKISYSQFQEVLANPEVKIVRADVLQKGLNKAIFIGELADPHH